MASHSKHVPSAQGCIAPKIVAGLLFVWFLLVAVVGYSGILIGSQAPIVPVYVVGAILMLCVAGWTISPVRSWLFGLELRFLVLVNFVRFVGIAFLVSSATEGGLPTIFAERAGYGDILVAVIALPLAIGFLPATSQFRCRLLLFWNVIGVLDLLQAVGTGLTFQLSGSSAMDPMLTAPLMYIPFYLVPLLMFVHLVIFYRLATNTLESEGVPLRLMRKVQ